MKFFVFALVLSIAGFAEVANKIPAWAYGTEPPSTPTAPKPADTTEKHLPGTSQNFTLAQINNPFGPADWFPQDHPAMPAVVAHGIKPNVWACGFCHYPNGKGKPENAPVSGLPATYFVQQMHDFRDGLRHSADPRKQNTALMIRFAKNMSENDIQTAADYFAQMPWPSGGTPWIKVVESKTVPKNTTSVGMYMPIEGAGVEPLGERIIEMPLKPEETEALRNPRSGFIAYVPIGSVERGKRLVTKGEGKTIACAVCHGADLRGMGPVPGIAGRSPSYVARQLYDIQQGTRKGTWAALMQPVVAKLSNNDLVDIAAYTASK